MSNNTSALDVVAATLSKDQQSIDALINRQDADVAYLFSGSITVLINLLLIITVAKSKKLRTGCYFLIANVSMASIVYSGSFFVTALKRLIRMKINVSEVQSRLGCSLEMFTCYLGQSACVALPLATATDRLLATVTPVRYKTRSRLLVIILASIGWSYALVDSCFTFYGNDPWEIVLNCNLISATEILYDVQSGCAIALAALVTLLYVCILILLKLQIRRAKLKSETVAVSKTKWQFKVAKSLSVDSVIHLITQVATRVGLAMLSLFPNINKWTLASYMRMTIFVGLCATFFVFLLMSFEFRKSFLNLFGFLPRVKKHLTKMVPSVSAIFISRNQVRN